MNNEFNILVRLHRNALTEAQKEYPIKTPSWLYPLATEKVFAKGISSLMKTYTESVLAEIEPSLEKWIRQTKRDNHSDAWETDYKRFLDKLASILTLAYGNGLLFTTELGKLLQTTSNHILAFAIIQWNKQTKEVLGDPYNALPPDWLAIKDMWMEETYKAIRGLAEEYNKKVNTILITGLLAGWVYNDFVEQLLALTKKMTGYRSALVARSWVGTLNGAITKGYAQGIGNDEYVWQTSLDEKVRGNPTGRYPKAIPSHWIMEGKICKWSDPTVYSEDGVKWKKRTSNMETLHPGFAIACRCTAGLYWSNFVKRIGG